MAVSRFNGPIPGQSLTHTPKNAKWEKPAQFTNKDDALDFMMKKLLNPTMTTRMITMLDSGTPVEAFVRILLFSGFTNGTWSIDLSVLIAKPLAAMIATIYYMIKGKQPPMISFNQGQPDQGLVQDLQNVRDAQEAPVDVGPKQRAAITDQIKRAGILGPR